MSDLRSGRIVYTNDLPIYAAFDEGAVDYPGRLVARPPARLNAKLLDGGLDLSPISAFHWALHVDRLALMPDLCIAARSDVWSVLCISDRPLRELGDVPIAVTSESASGRALLRILLERRYDARASFVETDDPYAVAASGAPALLIGDRAIDARLAFPSRSVHDLGTEWHAWTGLDMVFAVWAVHRDALRRDPEVVARALEALIRSRAWGMANIDRVIAAAERAHPRPPGFYAAYYETLHFDFDEGARAGLARFIHEAHALGMLPTEPGVYPEVPVCP